MKLKLKCTKETQAHKMYCKEIQINECFIKRHHPTSLVFASGLASNKDNYIMIFNNESMCVCTFNKIINEDQLIADVNGYVSAHSRFENEEYTIFNLDKLTNAIGEIKSNHKIVNQIVDMIKEHSNDKAFSLPKEAEKYFGKDDELTVAAIINMVYSNPRFASWVMSHRFNKQ